MKYVIDTREKKPFDIPNSVNKKLDTGDYSVEGYENYIALERKGLPDLFHCLAGQDYKRFKDQLKRVSAMRYGALLVTSNYANISWGYLHSDLPGDEAQNRLIGLSMDYDIPMWLVGNVEEGTKLTLKFLTQAYKRVESLDNKGKLE